MSYHSTITENDAQLDISVAIRFFGGRQIQEGISGCESVQSLQSIESQFTLPSVHRRQDKQWVHKVEHSTFTTGGMGRAATTFYKRLASMLSEKRDLPYSKIIGWIHCILSFTLLRASIQNMSIRGERSSTLYAVSDREQEPIDLQLA